MKVPADSILIEGQEVESDESTFTGESEVSKKSAFRKDSQDRCTLLAHSLITRGFGKAVVVAVGENTQAGKLMKMTVTQNEMTGLQ